MRVHLEASHLDLRKVFTVPGVPRRLISAGAGLLGRFPIPKFMRRKLWGFSARRLGVDLTEVPGDLRDYRNFLALFTRPLPEGARPLPEGDAWLSPADGRVVAATRVTSEGTWLIKGTPYTSRELVPGGDVRLLAGYQALQIYLAPYNYHRYHAPCDMTILEAVTEPGDLQPVDPSLVRRSMRVLATNKRILLHCQAADGTPFSMLFVGALNVGGMSFLHDDTLGKNPLIEGRRVYEPSHRVGRGDELGWFEFGSTVVLFAPGQRIPLKTEGETCRAREPLLAGTLRESN
jgi:phosphatidylserine decarboxylase